MTITTFETSGAPFSEAAERYELVAFDLYRNIHKGIRAELFEITSTAGRIDPSNRIERVGLADHVASVGDVLAVHAHQEDTVIDPVLGVHMPDLAEKIELDHAVLGPRFRMIAELARHTAEAAEADQRRLAHLLYLELTGFTSAYLAHQLVEERVIMPELINVVGLDAVLEMHIAIARNIPPGVMRHGLAFMLPAMNIDERTAVLTGMRMTAPRDAFDAVMGLVRSVLAPADYAAQAARLEP